VTGSHPPSLRDAGVVETGVEAGIATVRFGHPKSNSMPGTLLRRLAEAVAHAGIDPRARVIVLQSEGTGAFCAGASFDELKALENQAGGAAFFSGFAQVILAMVRAPKFVITRIQGKTAGGGVGLVAASDYAIAVRSAEVRLSELPLGLGPFVVGPVIEHKIGPGSFAALAVEAGWRSAEWAERHGLYAELVDSTQALDERVRTLAAQLAGYSPEAMRRLKEVLWERTLHWPELLAARAEISGHLAVTDASRAAVGR